MARGRKATDGAMLVRNCVWACVVRKLEGEGLTWDALDDRLLPMIGLAVGQCHVHSERRRTFHRYFSAGHDPSGHRGPCGRLLDLLHEKPRFSIAKNTFEHPLWEVAGRRPLEPEELKAIRRRLMERLSLFMPSVAQRLVASFHGIPGIGGYQNDRQGLAESMFNLVQSGSLDGLGICACNYLLALDSGTLELAAIHRETLIWGAERFGIRWELREDARSSLLRLIEARVLRRRHTALAGSDLGFPLGRREKRSDEQALFTRFPIVQDLPCGLVVTSKGPHIREFEADFTRRYRAYCDSLLPPASLSSGPGLESHVEEQRDALDVFETALLELLSVAEDQCEQELAVLQLLAHINPAVSAVTRSIAGSNYTGQASRYQNHLTNGWRAQYSISKLLDMDIASIGQL